MESNNLEQITTALKGYGTHELTDAELLYAEKLKFAISVLLDYPHYGREKQVAMIMEKYEVSRQHAYRLISEGQDLYPSIEKVSKDFERMRIAAFCWKMVHRCAGNDDEYNDNDNRIKAAKAEVIAKYDALRKEAVHVDRVKLLAEQQQAEINAIEDTRIEYRKPNTRDAAQYLKILKELYGLDEADEGSSKNVTVINVMKYDLASLGVTLPEDFDADKFIKQLENEYTSKQPNTIPIEPAN